ncbi:MAG: hypothetical protein ACJ75F_01305 [Flavisolibacter sp.]
MKPAAITGIFLFLTAIVHAQFSLLPQAGFDRTSTSVNYNKLGNFTPISGQTDFKATIRLDYKFKGGHGPYASIGTSPAVINLSFKSPSDAMNGLKSSASSLQWRLEGGYQYTTKAIRLTSHSAKTSQTAKSSVSSSESRNPCSSGCHSRMSCGNKMKSSKPAQKDLNLRIQPSLGFAYNPSATPDIVQDASGYQYNAGNWNTAFVSAIGFELGKGKQRLMTLSVHYAKGIGNLDTKTIVSEETGKPVATTFSSESSSWGLTVGVPFTLAKSKKPAAKKTSYHCQSSCQQYRMRCVKKI